MSLNTLRTRIGFVPQDTTLFLGNLRNNLCVNVKFFALSLAFKPFIGIPKACVLMLSSYQSSNGHGYFRRTAQLIQPLRLSSASIQLLVTKVRRSFPISEVVESYRRIGQDPISAPVKSNC
jgi:hypothetical protein